MATLFGGASSKTPIGGGLQGYSLPDKRGVARYYYTGPDDGYGRYRNVPTTTTTAVQTSAGATEITAERAPNTASYYGLNIPVSMGKRAITGVPIFAGPVRVDGSARYIDVAYSFGENGIPDDELLDTQLTKLWINGELVEERNISTGWSSSGSFNYVIYPGYQDQLPDPRIEKWLGATQTPAFRGLIYIMFYDMPLHQISPIYEIPFLRAELVDIVVSTTQVSEFSQTAPGAGIMDDQTIIPNWDRQHVYLFENISTTESYVTVVDLTTNSEISRSRLVNKDGSTLTSPLFSDAINGGSVLEPDTNLLISQRGFNNSRPLISLDPYTGVILGEFGVSGNGLSDTLTGVHAWEFSAPVSRGGAMLDRLIAKSGVVSDEIGFYRIGKGGEISLAYADVDVVLGDTSTGGSVKTMTTGDRIRLGSKGFGTVFVGRETQIDRITIQAGTTGDGQPIDVDADNPPRHLTPTTTPFGVLQSAAYVDIIETWDVQNGVVAVGDSELLDGQPTFGFTLSSAGDLSASALDDRVVAYIEYSSIREFRQFFINTLVLDGAHTGGIVEYDVVVSDNGTTWELVSGFNVTNTEKGLMIGSNAPATVLSKTQASLQMAGESYNTGAALSPLPSGKFVGYALRQKDYTNGTVSGFTPWAGGQDGLEVNNDIIVFDDILVPHRITLWTCHADHTIQMMFIEPKSEDIIVFFRSDTTGDDYVTRLVLNDTIHGLPTPPDPFGGGVTPQWTVQLLRNIPVWANLEYSWNWSDLGSGSLAYASSGTSKIVTLNIATGHQRELDFGPNWRAFGAGSDDPEAMDMQQRQVWNGSATYLISQWADDNPVVGFHMSKLTPFSTADTQYPLADLLRWMSLRVGYTAEEIDTSSITDLVTGAILLERVAFRDLMGGNIGPVYDFEVFESEGQIKFIKSLKGAAFTAAIIPLTALELAPMEGGEAIEVTDADAEAKRSPTSDIPDSVELKYLDPNNDYIVGSAFSRRTHFPFNTTGNISVEPKQYAVPLIMDAAEALLRSTRLLYRSWSDNTIVSYRVPTKFMTLEPADVVSIPIDGVTYNVRNIETVINADHSLSIIGRSVSSEEVDVVNAQDPLTIDTTVQGSSSSNLYYLDIPALTSADVNALVGSGLVTYTALASKGQGAWSHASLYVGFGPTFFPIYTTGNEVQASGIAISVLPKGVELRSDHESTLTVLLSDTDEDNPFVTITDAQISDGGNLVAYGRPGRWEIMQVKTVTVVTGNTYDLTDIVRALYGTEAYSGMHDVNDQFITLTRPPVRGDAYVQYDQLDTAIAMKAVGAKEDEANIAAEVFSLSGTFERMLPPTNLKATTSGSDILITWNRRTRLENLWVDSLESVPTESTSDGFELEILGNINDTIPIRTITGLTEPNYLYLAADIATDFTNVPDTVYLRAYHMSTEVGRSLPEQMELDVLA